MPELDDFDKGIIHERVSAISDRFNRPHVGAWVRFADGVERRISHIWRDENGNAVSVQTSAGGSFYLGNGYLSFSGSLFTGITPDTLTRASEPSMKLGSLWIFHHDHSRAHNGVHSEARFAVWECSESSEVTH